MTWPCKIPPQKQRFLSLPSVSLLPVLPFFLQTKLFYSLSLCQVFTYPPLCLLTKPFIFFLPWSMRNSHTIFFLLMFCLISQLLINHHNYLHNNGMPLLICLISRWVYKSCGEGIGRQGNLSAKVGISSTG
jgi:hypothetical protein